MARKCIVVFVGGVIFRDVKTKWAFSWNVFHHNVKSTELVPLWYMAAGDADVRGTPRCFHVQLNMSSSQAKHLDSFRRMKSTELGSASYPTFPAPCLQCTFAKRLRLSGIRALQFQHQTLFWVNVTLDRCLWNAGNGLYGCTSLFVVRLQRSSSVGATGGHNVFTCLFNGQEGDFSPLMWCSLCVCGTRVMRYLTVDKSSVFLLPDISVSRLLTILVQSQNSGLHAVYTSFYTIALLKRTFSIERLPQKEKLCVFVQTFVKRA